MSEPLVGVLALAAVTVGSLHSLAPDHWVPFAALARAQGWRPPKTAAITALCGFGHVTVSVLLGLLALVFGLEMLEVFGRRMEAVAGLLLISFGLVYALVGLRRALQWTLTGPQSSGVMAGRPPAHAHVHSHSHGHHHSHVTLGEHTVHSMTGWTLFLLFSADPCVAVIPILFAAAPLGGWETVTVVAAYEMATIATMVMLVLPASAAASRWRAAWLNRFGDAAAGAVIATTGMMVAALGW
jgi:nickel/cobalt transporter (NicO) family protein